MKIVASLLWFSAVVFAATSCVKGDETLVGPEKKSGVGEYTLTVTQSVGGMVMAEICACGMGDDCACGDCVYEGMCGGVDEDSIVVLKAVADEGWTFKRLVVRDVHGILSSEVDYDSVEFDMPAVDVVVGAEFERI